MKCHRRTFEARSVSYAVRSSGSLRSIIDLLWCLMRIASTSRLCDLEHLTWHAEQDPFMTLQVSVAAWSFLALTKVLFSLPKTIGGRTGRMSLFEISRLGSKENPKLAIFL